MTLTWPEALAAGAVLGLWLGIFFAAGLMFGHRKAVRELQGYYLDGYRDGRENGYLAGAQGRARHLRSVEREP